MKKAKKLLALFLAVLMAMTCLSAISASAIHDEAAANAQLAAWEDSSVDLSGVYADMSEKQAESLMKTLDTTLAAVLEQQNVKAKLYCDTTVAKLIVTIFPILDDALSGMGGGGISLSLAPATVAAGLTAYPEAAACLMAAESWADVDASKLVFGIEPGNGEQFRTVMSAVVNMGGLGLLVLMMLQDYILAPVLEALHSSTPVTAADAAALAAAQTSDQTEMYTLTIQYSLAPLFDAIDLFFAHPVEYLCDILPDLAYTYDNILVPGLLESLGMQLPPLSQLLGDLLAGLTDTTGVAFPAIDTNKLVHMGSAKVVESVMAIDMNHTTVSDPAAYVPGYRVQIDANKPMVFAAVAQYACEVLQDQNNQIAIGRLVVGAIGPEYQEDYDAIVAAAQSGSNLALADACLDLADKVIDSAAEQGGILGFFAKIAAFFNRIAQAILDLFKIF